MFSRFLGGIFEQETPNLVDPYIQYYRTIWYRTRQGQTIFPTKCCDQENQTPYTGPGMHHTLNQSPLSKNEVKEYIATKRISAVDLPCWYAPRDWCNTWLDCRWADKWPVTNFPKIFAITEITAIGQKFDGSSREPRLWISLSFVI